MTSDEAKVVLEIMVKVNGHCSCCHNCAATCTRSLMQAFIEKYPFTKKLAKLVFKSEYPKHELYPED